MMIKSPNWVKDLTQSVKAKLYPDARGRFILLFAIFDAMFVALLLLLLQNTELTVQNAELAKNYRQLEDSLVVERATRTAVGLVATLQSVIRETQVPKPTSIVGPTDDSTSPVVPTSTPMVVATPTQALPSPTVTPVPPTATRTPMPPTPTHTPIPPTSQPTPTDKPERPTPESAPTRPSASPPPTRPSKG